MLLPSDSSSCKVPDHLPVTVYVPPLGEQARITCSPLVATGVDKLKVSAWVDWNNSKVFDRLAVHKKGLQDTPHNSTPINFSKSETLNSFVLHRTGTTKFTYRLTTGDITLMLSPRPGNSALHNVQIEIGSLSSQIDAKGMYQEIIKSLSALGGQVVKEIVSEIHLAADLVGVSIQDTAFSDPQKWIKRADNFSIFLNRDRLSGITLGTGDIMFRAYDKILEMRTKRETAKQDFFARKWGGVDLDEVEVTRCEFQLRRPVLKEFSVPVNTVSEIFDNLQALWGYCTHEWARFCTAPVDRKNKHQSLSQLSEYWQLVQSAFFSIGDKIAARVRQICVKNIGALSQQFRGIAMSIVASHGVIGTHVKDVVHVAQRIVKEEILAFHSRDPSEFMRRMLIRFDECYASVL